MSVGERRPGIFPMLQIGPQVRCNTPTTSGKTGEPATIKPPSCSRAAILS
jgi:hypothetical protein